MMTDYSRAAQKRIDALATDAAEEFDSTILHNRVYEQVDGQHNRDNDLLQTLDLAERSYQLSDVVGEPHEGVIFDAANELDSVVNPLVDELVAEACATIVDEADDWTDAWSPEEIGKAKREASRWLFRHTDAAERADVDQSLLSEVAADA